LALIGGDQRGGQRGERDRTQCRFLGVEPLAS